VVTLDIDNASFQCAAHMDAATDSVLVR
jgi:hypothetical protein